MELKHGIFYGVGIGPGDPELLTQKALRVLRECPVLACPQTHSGEMLALDIVRGAMDVSEKTILPLHFAMSRNPAVQRKAHEDAAREVCRCLEQGMDVAMPNLGDVSIYSTYCYLMEIVQAAGFATAIIPGVTSFGAIAARRGISLTEMTTPVHIVPAGGDLETALQWPGTKILMKSGKQLPETIQAVREHANPAHSALVQNCGLPDERVFPNLAESAPGPEGSGYFSTVIVKE